MKFLKELKHNKYTLVLFFIFLGLFVLGAIVFSIVMPKSGNEKYGNRLDDIKKDNAEITSTQENKIIEEVKKKNFVKDVSINIEGRIINVIVEVKKDTSDKDAKSLGEIVLKATPEKQLKYYDIQLFLKNENKDAKGFPMIGYKNSSDKGFAF